MAANYLLAEMRRDSQPQSSLLVCALLTALRFRGSSCFRAVFGKLPCPYKDQIQGHPQGVGNPLERSYGWVSTPPFDAGNVGPIKLRAVGQLLLGEARFVPKGTNR